MSDERRRPTRKRPAEKLLTVDDARQAIWRYTSTDLDCPVMKLISAVNLGLGATNGTLEYEVARIKEMAERLRTAVRSPEPAR